jgi:RNA polymerase sigma-70 factor, ECF subfamily
VIRFLFGRHSDVMSFAQGRAIFREAKVRSALDEAAKASLASGQSPARGAAEASRMAQEAVDTDRVSGYGAVYPNDSDAQSGIGFAQPKSAVPASRAPTDSGMIPVGAVDWSSEAIQTRIRQLVTEHIDFVWRSLRALGVPTGDCDDGCQKVWWVVARKVASIEPGKERSFIFSVVMRVASDMRRSAQAQRKASLGDALPLDLDLASADPSAEELCDRQRARAMLEQLLGNIPWEQRVVFVMFEVEELGLQEIADALGVPRGTVASRLRLAREAFNRALARHQERAKHPSRPLPPDARGTVRPRPPMHSQERAVLGAELAGSGEATPSQSDERIHAMPNTNRRGPR